MVLGDWQQIVSTLSPETPVIFYVAQADGLAPDRYCCGRAVLPSRMWTARDGWVPCVTVDVGEEL